MMKNYVLILLATLIFFSCDKPKEKKTENIQQDFQTGFGPYFEAKDLVTTGVYYYPEHWDKSQWDRDLKNMAEMGFEFTHFAEFAWAMLEPQEGVYKFEWLDEAVGLAAKHGLKVIMCTPTPTPPAWMSQKYPEILVVKDDGLRAEHGTRQHVSWSSKKYRELIEKLLSKMAEHYGKDKRVWAWQLDNEPGHYGVEDYHPEAKKDFREWLKAKYKSLEELNRAWGTAFWSETLFDWNQVLLPNYKTQMNGANPHALLDFKRFNADKLAEYLHFQVTILRKYVDKDQWITSNYMHDHDKVNPWLNDKDLNVLSYTVYPVAGIFSNWGSVGDEGFRTGFPTRMSYSNDFFRYKKGFTGVMELQPGQVNWGRYNPQPYPGIVRAWLWNAFVGGCDFICSYRYRQPLSGGEHYHYGMVGTDGITPSSGGKEYSQFMAEIKELRKKYKPNNQMPEDYKNRRVAIIYSFDNLWGTQIESQTLQYDYQRMVFKLHQQLKSLGCMVDFISEDMDLSQYKMVVAPSYMLLDEKLVGKWKSYAENGGNLVLTTRSGFTDRDMHLWEAPYCKPILELIGANIPFYDHLPPDKFAKVEMDKSIYEWNNWADALEPLNGTETWATFKDQFYKGKVCVSHRTINNGSVSYIGPDTDDGKLEKAVFKKIMDKAKMKYIDLADGLIMDWRDGFWVAVNISTNTIEVPLAADAKIILGQKTLKPAEVVVWE